MEITYKMIPVGWELSMPFSLIEEDSKSSQAPVYPQVPLSEIDK